MSSRYDRWFVAAGLLAMASPSIAAGRDWQRLQMPKAAEVLARWKSPPPEYGPEPYYGIGDGVTDAAIAAELDRVKGLGFQAITVQWGRRLPYPYLSADYFAFFKRFVAAAKQRDMRIWIVDDAGYPSGFAGGKISAQAPALRMKALVKAGDWSVSGGGALDVPVPGDLIAVSAIDPVSGESHAIEPRDGRIGWQAPAGRTWRVIAVAHAFRTSPTRSDTNPTGKKDDTQSLHDYLDPEATARYIAVTHEAYRAAVGDEFGKTILGFRGDEPDYSIKGSLPWTGAFLATFKALKGYDPTADLPALLLDDDTRLTERQTLVRADYYDVFSRLFADTFFQMQSDWCARYGLQYQVHLNHEERQIELGKSEGDFFRSMRSVQSPGIDAIWHQIWTDTVSDFPRFGSSVAHLNGRPQAMTESFAAFRPTPELPVARYVVDEQLVRGINLFEFMYIPGGRPTPSFYADPDFPALAAYTRRASYLMSMGRPDAGVAVLQSRGTVWMRDKGADDMFVATERMLSEMQVDYDLVDEDAVGTTLKAGGGTFETASGNRYRSIIVPMPDLMPKAVVDRLRTFASSGGRVLFLGRTPPRITEGSYREARPARPDEFSWATVETGRLAPVPTPPDQPPAAPPPPQIVPPKLAAAVRSAVGMEDLELASRSTALRYTHRQLADAKVFFLFNESAAPLASTIMLRGAGRSVQSWDPSTGEERTVASRAVRGGRSLSIDLPRYGSQILVLR
ncbi:beta-galactosidase [Sphingomonas sp. AP4-R1]|uniref:glycosyl hydrolase n=1 Tax=Sphingomonas sp. AP4-R1 TaxID=2735134 RepID=UPI00149344DB|nr:glycosyl hydrolase [Sphingomonas sp. AP4-R1]QJU60112.1 beta-galactosidase [Sphingomonas sp. AP4-R1]